LSAGSTSEDSFTYTEFSLDASAFAPRAPTYSAIASA
jgi:hypothetical protein